MTRVIRSIVIALSSLLVLSAPARAAEHVDLLLVLASDVSRSVDTRKFQLQREGYAAALSNPRVIEAIRSGPHGKIAICFVEWSGATSLKLVIDWTIVGDAASARKFGDQMLELPRSFADRTSISAGLEFRWRNSSVRPIRRPPHHRCFGRRHQQFRPRYHSVRDEIGEGRHHQRPGDPVRDAAAVGSRAHQSARWARQLLSQQCDRRSGSFVMVAENHNSFGQAIVKKMIAEIAWVEPKKPVVMR